MLVIGLDAASQLSNFGYAIGTIARGKLSIQQAGILGDEPDVIGSTLVDALLAAPNAVIAIDAPLGWPAPLGESLFSHVAGDRISVEKNSLFRRHTDTVARETTGKTPLEIGADKIARAAHTALAVLNQLRDKSGLALPLFWSAEIRGAGAIEVYPAATLKMHCAPTGGYKEPEQRPVREAIAHALREAIPGLDQYVSSKADVFDACLCMLAVLDFVNGVCRAPRAEEMERAKKEGWIWVREQR